MRPSSVNSKKRLGDRGLIRDRDHPHPSAQHAQLVHGVERLRATRDLHIGAFSHDLATPAPASYQSLLRLTRRTTSSITGTSISTPTTVASAAPDSKPKRLMAAATASSKKLLAPIKADGQATLCDSPSRRLSQYASPELKRTWIRIGTASMTITNG